MSAQIAAQESHTTNYQWKNLSRIGGIAALIQLGCVITTFVVFAVLGGEPASPQEYFDILTTNRLAGILRMDFASLVNVILYSVTSLGIYATLHSYNKPFAGFATVMILLGISFSVSNHSGYTWIHLSDLYSAATTQAQRSQLLTAGQVIYNADWWRSTSGLISGIFMQGGMAFMSMIMLQHRVFSRYTAWAGILSNGLDWVHIFVTLFAPGIGEIILWVGGVFYFAWYPLLAWDLWRQGKR